MTKLKDIAYVGIKLDIQSKKKLLECVIGNNSYLEYSKFFCDHVTLEFGEDVTFSSLLALGEERELTVASDFVTDKKVMYLPVLLLDHPLAHITIATDAMTPPVYSKQHYEENFEKVRKLTFDNMNNTLQLKGVVSAYMRDGSIVTSLI